MTSITLNQLEAYVAVAELQSFSKAARRLGITQSSISTRIANLEIDFGVELFVRSRHHTELTAAGKQLLNEARFILGRCEAIEQRALAIGQSHEQRLLIATSELIEALESNPVAIEVAHQFPMLEVEYREMVSSQIIPAVRNREIDFGLVFKKAGTLEQLCSLSIGIQPLYCVCHVDHPLARLDSVERADLVKYRQIKLVGIGEYVDTIEQVSPQIWSATSLLTAIQLVNLGIGWLIAPHFMAEQYAESARWKILPLDDDSLPQGAEAILIWHENRALGPAAQFLIDRLKQIYKQRP